MEFKEIFDGLFNQREQLKVVFVGSSNTDGKPNAAPKMLVNMVQPNTVFLLDYKFTQTHSNIKENSRLSISIMDDKNFVGFRLNGKCKILEAGEEFEAVKEIWRKRLVAYEVERIIQRIKGGVSPRDAENVLPDDFVVIKMTAYEAAQVKPDRIFRALRP